MDTFDEMVEIEEFIELVALGISPVNAGVQVGWSPQKTKSMMADPDFADMLEGACDRADATIVEALYNKAKQGNVSAIQMWLFNRRPNDWKDVKRIEVRSEHQVQVAVVESVKVGVLDLLRSEGVGALQALNPGTVIDVDEG